MSVKNNMGRVQCFILLVLAIQEADTGSGFKTNLGKKLVRCIPPSKKASYSMYRGIIV
jgi:hypothetical protein